MTKLTALALASLLGIASLAGESDANACISAMVERAPAPKAVNKPADIAAAERSLESGQSLIAARTVLRAFPKIASAKIDPSDPIQTRAVRVMALSIARLEGGLSPKGEPHLLPEQRSKNLAWPVMQLKALNGARPNDPAVQADLGEVLSKVPAHRAEAMTLLAGLADKDLMGSPQAYAALAQLRAQAGDGAGATAALQRCKTMTTVASVCVAPAASPST
jgi:hypothetical protein